MAALAYSRTEELVNAHMGLVHDEARKYNYALAGSDTSLEYEDLVQEGTMALFTAAEKFDSKRGTDFASFAEEIIRQHMKRAVCNQSRLVRIPEGQFETYAKIRQAIAELNEEGISEPDNKMISRKSGIPVAKIEYVTRNIESGRNTVSLNTPLPGSEDEDDAPDRIELLADEYKDPSEGMVASSIGDTLKNMIGILSLREIEVLILRYGLEGEEERTLKEIAKELDVSAERVRQIEKAALDKLRSSEGFEKLRNLR